MRATKSSGISMWWVKLCDSTTAWSSPRRWRSFLAAASSSAQRSGAYTMAFISSVPSSRRTGAAGAAPRLSIAILSARSDVNTTPLL